MGRKISIVLFWLIIVLSVVALSRTTWSDWRGSLRIGISVVPFVLLTSWFQSRFTGPRRRIAGVMIYAVCFAMVSGSILLWDWTLFRRGFEIHSDRVEAWLAGVVFVISGSAFVWSLARLLRKAERMPT